MEDVMFVISGLLAPLVEVRQHGVAELEPVFHWVLLALRVAVDEFLTRSDRVEVKQLSHFLSLVWLYVLEQVVQLDLYAKQRVSKNNEHQENMRASPTQQKSAYLRLCLRLHFHLHM